jgi:DNA polymerase III delta prime subunit
MFENLWVEKYRPSTLDEVVLSDHNRSIFKQFSDNKEIPNLLFVGNAGIGKTSLAKVICKSMLNAQYLYINASDENGIDTIRTKVTGFAQTKSFDGTIKCIILDEVDGLTLDAQRALRNTMEEYAQLTRFILTANYKHRVIPALQSRCQSFDLTPPLEMCVDRINSILKTEGIEVADEYHERLKMFVKGTFPDLRKCINEIQKSIIGGKISFDSLIKVKDTFVEGIYNVIQQGYVLKARKKVIESEQVFNGDYTELLRALFNHIHDADIKDSVKSHQLIIVSEHLYRAAFVVDPEINFYSCLLAISV